MSQSGGVEPSNRWVELLDSVVAGNWSERWPRGPVIASLRLPDRLLSWETGVVRGEWSVEPAMFHSAAALFGGYLAALTDLATTWAMFTVLGDDEFFNTTDLRVSFFRPVTDGVLSFEGRVVNRGKRMAHVEAIFTDQRERVMAKGSATEVILPMPEVGTG